MHRLDDGITRDHRGRRLRPCAAGCGARMRDDYLSPLCRACRRRHAAIAAAAAAEAAESEREESDPADLTELAARVEAARRLKAEVGGRRLRPGELRRAFAGIGEDVR